MLVFGLYSPSAKETLLRKQVEIVDGVALLLFTNADTRDLPVGSYKYNLRIVTNPEYNAEGFVICADATDNVMSIYNDLPKFELLEAGVHTLMLSTAVSYLYVRFAPGIKSTFAASLVIT